MKYFFIFIIVVLSFDIISCISGDAFHMYYEAWGVRSDAVWDREEYHTLQIGHATSKDGIRWEKDKANNPVIPQGADGECDSSGTWDQFVIYEDGLFKMWYDGNRESCEWGYAVSINGRKPF